MGKNNSRFFVTILEPPLKMDLFLESGAEFLIDPPIIFFLVADGSNLGFEEDGPSPTPGFSFAKLLDLVFVAMAFSSAIDSLCLSKPCLNFDLTLSPFLFNIHQLE